jgi:polysaccharide pyruvyl transferase WcaK-like protein
MKKISIIGATFIGNRGAEAMLCTVINKVSEKYPDSQFNVFSYYPKDDIKLLENSQHKLKDKIKIYSSTPLYISAILFPSAILFNILSFCKLKFLTKLLPKSIQALAESNALVDIAGVSFMDGRAVFLPFNILTILPAMLVKTPVLKFAQGLGPFTQFPVKFCAKIFLPKCKQTFARGDITLKHLNDFFNNKTFFQPACDVAFNHQKNYSITNENSEYVAQLVKKLKDNKKNNKIIIGLCPSSVVYSKTQKQGIDYIDSILKIINKLLQNENIVILLFPNATRETNISKLRNNDLAIIKLIKDKLINNSDILKNNIITVEKDINTDGIKNLIELCEITAISRFHAMIASLTLNIPPVVLGWSHKYLEVMKQFELEDNVLDYSDMKIDTANKIIEVLKNKNNQKKLIEKYLKDVKKDSFSQFEYLFGIIK